MTQFNHVVVGSQSVHLPIQTAQFSTKTTSLEDIKQYEARYYRLKYAEQKALDSTFNTRILEVAGH
jgi:hypothetical protein